jgi:integrase
MWILLSFLLCVGLWFVVWLNRSRAKYIPTVNEIIARMKKEIYSVPNRSEGTCREFAYLTDKYIKPFFGHLSAADIKKNWEPFKIHIKRTRPEMKFEHLRKVTRRILSYAFECELLDHVSKLKLTPDEKSLRRPVAYDQYEYNLVFNADVPQGFKADTVRKIRLKRQIALETGLRDPSEIHRLQKKWFDFKRLGIQLPPKFVKTRQGRFIPISTELAREIQDWISEQRVITGFLFPMRGDPSKPEGPSDKSWQAYKKAIGIERTRYEMRHSHATARIAAGENSTQVAVDMGTSPAMLTRVYVRPPKERGTQIANRIRSQYR